MIDLMCASTYWCCHLLVLNVVLVGSSLYGNETDRRGNVTLVVRALANDELDRTVTEIRVSNDGRYLCRNIRVFLALNGKTGNTCSCLEQRRHSALHSCAWYRVYSGVVTQRNHSAITLTSVLSGCYRAEQNCRCDQTSCPRRPRVRRLDTSWQADGIALANWSVAVSSSLLLGRHTASHTLPSLHIDLGRVCDRDAGVVRHCVRGSMIVSVLRCVNTSHLASDNSAGPLCDPISRHLAPLSDVQQSSPQSSQSRRLQLEIHSPDVLLYPGMYRLEVRSNDSVYPRYLSWLCAGYSLMCPLHISYINVTNSLWLSTPSKPASDDGRRVLLLLLSCCCLLMAAAAAAVCRLWLRRRHGNSPPKRASPLCSSNCSELSSLLSGAGSPVLLLHSGSAGCSHAVRDIVRLLKAAHVPFVDVHSACVRRSIATSPVESLFSDNPQLRVLLVPQSGHSSDTPPVQVNECARLSVYHCFLRWLTHSPFSADYSRLFVMVTGEDDDSDGVMMSLVPGCRYHWPSDLHHLVNHLSADSVHTRGRCDTSDCDEFDDVDDSATEDVNELMITKKTAHADPINAILESFDDMRFVL